MENRISIAPGPVEQANIVKSLIADLAALTQEDAPLASHDVLDRCVTTFNAFARVDAYELTPVEFFYEPVDAEMHLHWLLGRLVSMFDLALVDTCLRENHHATPYLPLLR